MVLTRHSNPPMVNRLSSRDMEREMRQLGVIAMLALLPAIDGFAQEGSKTLASTLEVFVFPAAGQQYRLLDDLRV